MAPGCSAVILQQQQQDQNQQVKDIEQYENKNLSDLVYSTNMHEANNQIPLPLTPPPEESNTETIFSFDQRYHNQPEKQISQQFYFADTVDSFEILEQTIMKQKRMAKTKNTDLRLKVLLKRTFNLVCDLMDQENGLSEPELMSLSFSNSESSEDLPAGIDIGVDVSETFDEDDSDDEKDSDDEDSEEEEDDEQQQQQHTNSDQIIPVFETQSETNNQQFNSQINFQTITLNQYNYVDYDNQSKNENIRFLLSNDEQVLNDEEKSNEGEHFISLEPVMTFFEQQSVSNKRKLTEEEEYEDIDSSDMYVKRFKLNRSLSSSDEENETKYTSNRTESNPNSYLFNNLTNNDLKLKSSRKEEPSIKVFKVSSINFYS